MKILFSYQGKNPELKFDLTIILTFKQRKPNQIHFWLKGFSQINR